MDIKVKGKWKYLYRAIDSEGSSIDFMLSENRDIHAVKRFFKKALSSPHKTKQLNNIIEQDHRFIKRITNPMMGSKSFQTAEETLAEIEAFPILRKQQVEISPAISNVEWINKLFGLAA